MSERSLLTNHSINRAIANLLKLAEDPAFQIRVRDLGPEHKSVIRSAELFARQLAEQVENSSDAEISLNGLNQIATNLTNAFNEINAFRSNGNTGHIDAAGGNLDGAMSSAAWTFFSRPLKRSRIYGETINSVRNAAEEAIKHSEDRLIELTLKVEELQEEVVRQINNIHETTNLLESVRSSSNARLDEISSEFSRIKGEIETERSQDRIRRDDEFRAFMSEEDQLASELTKKIADYEQQAKTILQIVGNIGITGNFQKRSADEASAANFWRWVTVGLFGVGVFLITMSLWKNLQTGGSVNVLLVRIAVGVAIALPAIYTARESARHRTNSDQAKQIQLELASLAPFIENLPEQERWKILAGLTPKYFGTGGPSPHEPQIGMPTDQLFQTVDKLVDRLPKL